LSSKTGAPSWSVSSSPDRLRSPAHVFSVQGVLAGFDQKSNIVLADSKERVYSSDEGVEEVPLGLYLVKGEMMCVPLPAARPSICVATDSRLFYLHRCLVGELDEEIDKSVDLASIRAEPIPPIRYG
jgi:U6 snRNA-associated Sm-like protein LSm8